MGKGLVTSALSKYKGKATKPNKDDTHTITQNNSQPSTSKQIIHRQQSLTPRTNKSESHNLHPGVTAKVKVTSAIVSSFVAKSKFENAPQNTGIKVDIQATNTQPKIDLIATQPKSGPTTLSIDHNVRVEQIEGRQDVLVKKFTNVNDINKNVRNLDVEHTAEAKGLQALIEQNRVDDKALINLYAALGMATSYVCQNDIDLSYNTFSVDDDPYIYIETTFDELAGPATFVNLHNNYGDTSIFADYSIYSNRTVGDRCKLLTDTFNTFKEGIACVTVDWQPSGWLNDIPSPLEIKEQRFITPILTAGANISQIPIMDRFFTRLDTVLAIFNNRRIVYYGTGGCRFQHDFADLNNNKGLDVTQVIRTINSEANNYEVFSTFIAGCPIFTPLVSTDLSWSRFMVECFQRTGSIVSVGKNVIASCGAMNVQAEAFSFTDQFSACLLLNSIVEFQANRLTRNTLLNLLTAHSFEQTSFDINYPMELDDFITSSITNDDSLYALIFLFLNKNYSQFVISEAAALINEIHLFAEVETKDFFSSHLLSNTLTNKRSKFLPVVESFYRSGSLDAFLQTILLEHYVPMYDVKFAFRQHKESYLNLFSLLDILLFISMFPKLSWANSIQLGRRIHSILLESFPNNYNEFIENYGVISEYINGEWVARPDMVGLADFDSLGGINRTPKQYSILVITPQGLTDDTMAICTMANLTTWLSGMINIRNKNRANLPFATNAQYYHSSWPVVNGFNTQLVNNVLSLRLTAIIQYMSTLICLKINQSQIDCKNDIASLISMFSAFKRSVSGFSRLLCVFGNLLTKILANGYFIWYEWLTPNNYQYGHPIVSLAISDDNGRVNSRIPITRKTATIDIMISTYSLINIVTIDQSLDRGINSMNLANGHIDHATYINPLPAPSIVDTYIKLLMTARSEYEKISLIHSWYVGEFNAYTAAFTPQLTSNVRNTVARHISKSINSEFFPMMIETLSCEFERYSLDLRGDWSLSLTDIYLTSNFNGNLNGNQIFGLNIFTHTQLSEAALHIANQLVMRPDSPLYQNVNSFIISMRSVDRFNYNEQCPETDYHHRINLLGRDVRPNSFRILFYDEMPHPSVPNQRVTALRIHLGDDIYFTTNELFRSNRRYLIIINNPSCFMPADYNLIHKLVVGGVLDIDVRDFSLNYNIVYQDSISEHYDSELDSRTSWIRQSFLPATNNSILTYTFYHTTNLVVSNSIIYRPYTRFLYLPRNFRRTNLVAEYILNSDVQDQNMIRVLNARLWHGNDNPAITIGGADALTLPEFRLNNKFRYYYKNNVKQIMPKPTITGSACIG
ncbi:major core protein [Psammotettix alienus reovirus]|nr:major core protein [Psammotettix alienus reovirus]